MSLGLAAVCALVLAVPAMAHNFTASRLAHPLSEAEPGKTRGVSIESELHTGEHNQRFVFNNFEILCAAAAKALTVGEGAITWTTNQTFASEVKFNKCLTKVKFGTFTGGLKTSFNVNPETKKSEPIKILWHVNGFAEIGTGETFSEVEIGGGAASFNISGKICKISWPAQVVPAKAEKKPLEEYSSATYSNKTVLLEKPSPYFPTAEQKRLVISNIFKGMKWVYEEGQCVGEGGFETPAPHTEGTNAKYEGDLEMQLVNGNLGFE